MSEPVVSTLLAVRSIVLNLVQIQAKLTSVKMIHKKIRFFLQALAEIVVRSSHS